MKKNECSATQREMGWTFRSGSKRRSLWGTDIEPKLNGVRGKPRGFLEEEHDSRKDRMYKALEQGLHSTFEGKIGSQGTRRILRKGEDGNKWVWRGSKGLDLVGFYRN